MNLSHASKLLALFSERSKALAFVRRLTYGSPYVDPEDVVGETLAACASPGACLPDSQGALLCYFFGALRNRARSALKRETSESVKLRGYAVELGQQIPQVEAKPWA